MNQSQNRRLGSLKMRKIGNLRPISYFTQFKKKSNLPFIISSTNPKVLSIIRIEQEAGARENDFRVCIDVPAFSSVLDKVGDRRFVIYSINGSTRTGKSFVLNYFLRYFNTDPSQPNWVDTILPEEFSWRSGADRETVGINLWSEPFFVKTKDNEEVGVLLMDCQGLFDPQTSMTQSAVIFTLSNLLSSVMIYNAMGKLDESTLQQFKFNSDYAKSVTGEKKVDVKKLIILLRDFSQGVEYHFGYHDKYHYPPPLTTEVDVTSNYFNWFMFDDKMIKSNLKIRKEVIDNYNEIGYFLMPSPGKEFLQSKNPSHSYVDPIFKDYLEKFVEFTVQNPEKFVKTVGGEHESRTGTEFKAFVELWAKEFKNCIHPEVISLSESTSKLQNEYAFRDCIKYYQRQVDNFIHLNVEGQSDEDMQNGSNLIIDQTLDLFRVKQKSGFGSRSGSDKDKVLQEYIEKLRQELDREYYPFYFELNQHRREANKSIWTKMTKATRGYWIYSRDKIVEHQVIRVVLKVAIWVIGVIAAYYGVHGL